MIKNIIQFGSRFMDYKMGALGALAMASLIFSINYIVSDNLVGSCTAALKQGTYSFFVGGIIIRSCEYLSTRIKKYAFAIFLAILIPSCTTIFLTYNIHLMKGTPRPLESTIPTTFSIPITAFWAYRSRKTFDFNSSPNQL